MKKKIDSYIDYNDIVLGKSHNTIRSYKRDLYQFLEYVNSENIENFESIDSMFIRRYIAYLNTELKVEKRSINRKLSAVRSFFKYLNYNEIIEENRIQYISMPKFEKKIPTFLLKDEVDMIRSVIKVDTVEGVRDRCMIETLYSSGVRSEELLDLSEQAIDFDEMQIKVLGKGNKERITFISQAAKNWIQKYINLKKEKYKNYDRNILFVNSRGTKLTTRSLRRIVEKYAKLANLKKEVSPHTFRHSFATELLNSGVDIRYVQELLGHSSLMTTQVYTHISKKMLKDIYMKVHPMAKQEKINSKEENNE